MLNCENKSTEICFLSQYSYDLLRCNLKHMEHLLKLETLQKKYFLLLCRKTEQHSIICRLCTRVSASFVVSPPPGLVHCAGTLPQANRHHHGPRHGQLVLLQSFCWEPSGHQWAERCHQRGCYNSENRWPSSNAQCAVKLFDQIV